MSQLISEAKVRTYDNIGTKYAGGVSNRFPVPSFGGGGPAPYGGAPTSYGGAPASYGGAPSSYGVAPNSFSAPQQVVYPSQPLRAVLAYIVISFIILIIIISPLFLQVLIAQLL